MIANPKKAEGNTKEEVNEKQNKGGKRLIKLKVGSQISGNPEWAKKTDIQIKNIHWIRGNNTHTTEIKEIKYYKQIYGNKFENLNKVCISSKKQRSARTVTRIRKFE